MKRQDHYATLKIDRCASCAEIRQAYRRLAQRFHPDVSKDKDGERKFKNVAEAYRTLKHPESKAPYDHQIKNICSGGVEVRNADQLEMNNLNHVFSMWHSWSWFWLTGGGNIK